MKILSRTTRKIIGKWHARIRYEDDNGNKRELLRRSETNTKTGAKTLRAKLETELLKKGRTELVAAKITFRQLVEYAKTTRYVEPQILTFLWSSFSGMSILEVCTTTKLVAIQCHKLSLIRVGHQRAFSFE